VYVFYGINQLAFNRLVLPTQEFILYYQFNILRVILSPYHNLQFSKYKLIISLNLKVYSPKSQPFEDLEEEDWLKSDDFQDEDETLEDILKGADLVEEVELG